MAIEMTQKTSPFVKGGLRGIYYLVLRPSSSQPSFTKEGASIVAIEMTKKTSPFVKGGLRGIYYLVLTPNSS